MTVERQLYLDLDRASEVALPEQIVREIRRRVVLGSLVPGDRLPSARTLARSLGVSRGTVDLAYEQLAAEGYVTLRPRSGTFIDPELPAAALRPGPAAVHVPHRQHRGRVRIDLRPGQGGASPQQEPQFRAAWRRALDIAVDREDPLGQERLRTAVAEHLRIMRGMVVDPADIIVTGGSRDGLRTVLAATGAAAIAVEDPGFPGLRRALGSVAALPVEVDEHGISVAGLAALLGGSTGETPPNAPPRPGAVLVTPNHQFPYGTAMPVKRRAELTAWAAGSEVLLLEDDYDSEARYLRPAIPPLYDSAPVGTAVHIGTFSTVLTRTVGTGYVVATGAVGAQVRAARERLGPAVSPLLQHAIAEYLSTGGLRSRITRGRRRMRAAEAVVEDYRDLPGLVHSGPSLVIEMSAGASEEIRRRLESRGTLVGDLASGWHGRARRHGLVIAYANATPEQLRETLDAVAAGLRSV
ncbi:pyridoxine biosynthesis transcriptional regulator PdxR [Brevibacterium daeguense]|uniref:Pyridoxine biosynthesis transcriptional regulator PdxR n=1 Tax=Brevibacterium daeguense TaxID=909936 RepID=A0ABP8EJH1_9MICO|nr:PLP-dependent aminotransferase family protein [Brevibacterium daeguense]